MKWKFVFNSTMNHHYWGTRDKCLEFVRQSPYKFFTWNGEVCSVIDGESIGITVQDLI